MSYQIVNNKGFEEIICILANNHRRGDGYFSDDMLKAWANEVEFHLTEGNGAYFELRSTETISGHTEIHTLSSDSIEWMDN